MRSPPTTPLFCGNPTISISCASRCCRRWRAASPWTSGVPPARPARRSGPWLASCDDALPASRIRWWRTDISRKALAQAQRAVYPAERLNGLSPAWIKRYFAPEGGPPKILSCQTGHPGARPSFRRMNLIEPITWSEQFPVIFCRNVMIYFDRADAGARGRQAGAQPGAGRLSVCRPCGEPDRYRPRAGICAAGRLPQAGSQDGGPWSRSS